MYSEAYKGYDFTNHLLSFYTDSMIREKAANLVIRQKPLRVLDIATGTGDMAIRIAELAKQSGISTEITAIDTNRAMLSIAKAKAARKNLKGIKFQVCDTLSIKYPGNYFDAAVCSFAVKNFESVDRFVSEAKRVLKTGGKLTIIDISMPERPAGRLAFRAYLAYMRLFGAVTGKNLYKWLPGSTAGFSRADLLKRIKKSGFTRLCVKEFLFGIAYIAECTKT